MRNFQIFMEMFIKRIDKIAKEKYNILIKASLKRCFNKYPKLYIQS